MEKVQPLFLLEIMSDREFRLGHSDESIKRATDSSGQAKDAQIGIDRGLVLDTTSVKPPPPPGTGWIFSEEKGGYVRASGRDANHVLESGDPKMARMGFGEPPTKGRPRK
ncbi:MAG: hypothetical protein NUV69_01150 [Candidatus Curtissbacteria bacterium]|nr:hypothetical protein [Candidatus Curtissbacteria bacterium]